MKALTYPDAYGPWTREYWLKGLDPITRQSVWYINRYMLSVIRMTAKCDPYLPVGATVKLRIPARYQPSVSAPQEPR